jgi:hypothetical protein
LLISALFSALAFFVAEFLPTSRTPGMVMISHIAVIAVIYIVLTYALVMRRPVAIVRTHLRKDEWNRFATLAVGDAIAEQVTRDKVQIIINRDRARAAGV